ncbi:hypothetical protein S1OALGB6SA_2036 [Olavius algarvensis spirochete endosymbiont]|uniref:P-loop NTPase n=1 Tax=Olavius algarvensis spirochete endosymbiont TaxID=260710 RepID=UPI00052DAB53|nr:P-loop NTPase [Olavius algarvensis spirochete endosymbiont]KGM42971.1 hypothetical protein JY97_10360 [Alkalispirochaeta odontotermitis]VDB00944.1 hypothetical protein S1OALGB6SA_2036 [Olavius algarvensis spirochete endosymbiont]
MILNENVDRKIIPVAGGKGGVGKSVIAANLALSMCLYGKKTILVDLDLGGSNIHTLLGLRNINPGIGNFVSNRKYSINELLSPTEWENLYFIPGDVLVYGIGELNKSVKARIIKGLLDIEADYIIVDLGGGTNFTVIDFFLISNSGLIVTTPQAISIMNAYSFLKNYVFRFLQRVFAADKLISSYFRKTLKERQPGDRKTVTDMISDIKSIDSTLGNKADAFLEVLQPKLILNRIVGIEDASLAEGLRDLCAQNLSINLEGLGTVMNEEIVNRSVNLQRPFILDNEENIATAEIHRIAQKIIQSGNFPKMPLELDYYADSFELIHIEMENDLAAIQGNVKNTDSQVNYDVDKLLELIRIQQGKIQELQGTVRMLSISE